MSKRVTYRRNPAAAACVRTKKDEVTDRAHRFRANQEGCRPKGPKICGYCGALRDVIPHHVNGFPDDTRPANLAWACRRCNTALGLWFARLGLGRRTKQRNPRPQQMGLSAGKGKGSPIDEYGRYIYTLRVARGEIAGDPDQAWADIMATPKGRRSEFTVESWVARKRLYGPSGGATGRPPEVPF